MHRLALSLGMLKAALLEQASDDELDDWVAYDKIEPLPDPWLQTGIIASTQFNMLRSSETPAKAPIDFIPVAKKPIRRQPVALMQATMRMLTTSREAKP